MRHMRGPKNMELSSGGWAPCSTGVPTQRVFWEPICISASAGVVRWCILPQWILYFAHFTMGDLRAHLPTASWVFSSFWLKMAWPPCSTLPIHLRDFILFPRMKKVLKGKCFADVEEMKQEMAEALKGIKIKEFKNWFEQWKKCLSRCIVSNGEYFEDD